MFTVHNEIIMQTSLFNHSMIFELNRQQQKKKKNNNKERKKITFFLILVSEKIKYAI